jgi:hypothetical protein
MTAAEVLEYLAGRSFRVGLTDDGERIRVEPAPTDATLLERIRARKPEILAFLRELGAPAATLHAFVCLSSSDTDNVAEYGVCIACGIPWSMHGEPPISAWERVDDPNSVLLQAAAIVCAASASVGSGGNV